METNRKCSWWQVQIFEYLGYWPTKLHSEICTKHKSSSLAAFWHGCMHLCTLCHDEQPPTLLLQFGLPTVKAAHTGTWSDLRHQLLIGHRISQTFQPWLWHEDKSALNFSTCFLWMEHQSSLVITPTKQSSFSASECSILCSAVHTSTQHAHEETETFLLLDVVPNHKLQKRTDSTIFKQWNYWFRLSCFLCWEALNNLMAFQGKRRRFFFW